MEEQTIYLIIGIVIGLAAGAAFGALWGLSQHEWVYCRVTAYMTHRVRKAMESLGIEEWVIDKVQEYMGSAIIPPHVPCPAPPAKPQRDLDKEPYMLDEVVYRLSPEDMKGNGEMYCADNCPYKAWRLEKVKSDGTIIQISEHDLRNHTIKTIDDPYYKTIEAIADAIIKNYYCFLADFDRRKWIYLTE